MSIDEDYYKLIIAKGAFDGSYIQYESKGDKGKNLSIKEYLNIIEPDLRDIINDHKTRGLARYHSSNKAWLAETSSEWKIQLTMAKSKVTMHTKSNNEKIMICSETNEIIEELF